ncbi:sensor domain-containing protein [Pseudomarimonas salicorniae]|uniref:EAL domain-containing protein n=1 Tax=Pseudomarimonas salicorniae TaxID=2933270 RepID=A0ABT0GH06_9GAMM|nr:EAL domain-containing protein [Lysobacter sp. CAU 1642]MCK7593352.1 EAL domain-containing protein [Lysobacter sp. CAU 1642]
MSLGSLQALIESVLEAVWLVDAEEQRILAVNRAAETLLGLPRERLIGQPVVNFAATSQDLFFWEDVAAGRGDSIYSETLVTRPDLSVVQVDRRVSRLCVDGSEPMLVVAMIDRSAQRQVEQELETIIAELRATLESTADGILVLDMEGGIRGYNHRFAELWDLPDVLLTRRDDAAVLAWLSQHVVDPEGYSERFSHIRRSPLLEAEDMLLLRSGRVLERVTLPQYARGRPIGRVFSFRDITQRLADEARLKLAASVFESSLDAIFVADHTLHLVAANPAFSRLTGFERSHIKGLPSERFLAEQAGSTSFSEVRAALIEHDYWQGELWARRSSGEAYPCLLSVVRIRGEEDQPDTFIGFFKDLTEAMAAKRRIEELAFTDALTGLPNRIMLRDRFEFAVRHAQRSRSGFAVMFIDLDRFKQINDSLGHAFGDRVLVEIADRLRIGLRAVDTASRLGGDEFVLVLSQVDAAGAEIAARRLLTDLAKPVVVDEMTFTLTASIGIAMYPDDGEDADELIKNADSAMYAVKERGRSDFRFYQRHMNVGLLSRMKLDQALRRALDADLLELHYQPKLGIADGRLVGVEALLRWCDDELGEVPPSRFIPIAEESGAIIPIGQWVLERAAAQAAAWAGRGWRVPVAVNLSAMQFNQSDFVESLGRLLERHALPGELLELELTESVLIADADDAMRRLHSLRELGLRLAIDDFGTGYSSLGYLKRFPIERLKIDRSFISDIPGNEEDEAIAVAIIELARALRLAVTAEGVETAAQKAFLARHGCTEMQGYLVAPALPADEVYARFSGRE